jgi:hypothetical protein
MFPNKNGDFFDSIDPKRTSARSSAGTFSSSPTLGFAQLT